MRYLARRYGEYFGFRVPNVLSTGSLPFRGQELENRIKDIYLEGNVVVINRINKLNTRALIETVVQVRKRFPKELIYLPGFGLPNDYPILFYIGVDLLDDSPLRLLGDDQCTGEFGLYKGEGCRERNDAEKGRVLELVDIALRNDRFRELVETHSFSNFSKEALRIMDMEFYPYMERFMDLRPKKIVASSVEGIYRPEVVNYRERVKGMRQTSENLLLIPCSAIKPYSDSKTHRILRSFIHPYLDGLQEVIVTSPLGLVPRELESFFPAMYYDIPVTGYWFQEEKRILSEFSAEFFKGKKYSNVFYILPKEESEILDLFEEPEGIIGNLNAENSERISTILGKHGIKGDRKKKTAVESSNLIKFNYGMDIEPDELFTKKEGNRSIVLLNGMPILVKTVSGLKMTKAFGEMLLSAGKRIVETEGVFKGDNLFIPGVRKISEDVRPGMEVALVKEGSVVGRGISQISDIDLEFEKKGAGVTDITYFEDRG